MAAARTSAVVLADDDVRWDPQALGRAVLLLEQADLVAPQNVFDPLPWHARWDSARSLLNRAFGADYPGTFVVRRATFEQMGGYDGDVLFENLELMRTVQAAGGLVARPLDLVVPRRPPATGRFWGQRMRQAYDDLAQPWRAGAFLLVLPGVAVAARSGRLRPVMAAAVAVVAMAERGRRRGGAARHVPPSVVLFAPLWVLERSVCIWVAVALRLTGGAPYAGTRITCAAHSIGSLRRSRATRRFPE
jgi:hypothetical protein